MERLGTGIQGVAGRLDSFGPGGYAYLFERTFDRKNMMQAIDSEAVVSSSKLEQILRHAAQTFADKGYEGASIRDISRASGVSLSGLYYYVKSKQEILYLIQIYTFRTILQRLQNFLRGVSDPYERLRILVRNHLEYFLQHPLEMKVLAREDDALEGAYRKKVAEIKRKYFAIAVEIYEGLQSENPQEAVSSRVAVLSLFGMMNWIYTWHRAPRDPSAEELSDAIAQIFLHGVMSERCGRPKAARSRGNSIRIGAQVAV